MEDKIKEEFKRIAKDEPINFKKEDLFNLCEKAEYIAEYIKGNWEALSVNNAIAIKGNWGYGKSSVIKTWKDNNLFGNEIIISEVDSWRYEGDIDLKLTLINEIYKGSKDEKVKKLKNSLIRYSMSVKNRAKTYVASKIGYDLENVTSKEEELNKIEQYIKELSSLTLQKRIIVIDNVDRMSPANLVKFINSIKYLFSLFANKDIIFVVLIDEDYMVHSFKEFLNLEENKVHEYIDKIFVRTFEIMPIVSSKSFPNINKENLAFIDFSLDSNPRMILKFLNYYSTTFDIKELQINSFHVMYKIYLCCLKVRNPFQFKKIISQEMNWINLKSTISIIMNKKDGGKVIKNLKYYPIWINGQSFYVSDWISYFIPCPGKSISLEISNQFKMIDLININPNYKIVKKFILYFNSIEKIQRNNKNYVDISEFKEILDEAAKTA